MMKDSMHDRHKHRAGTRGGHYNRSPMSAPALTRSTTLPTRPGKPHERVNSAIAAVLLSIGTTQLAAAADCPEPNSASASTRPSRVAAAPSDAASADQPFELAADSVEAVLEGDMRLKGNVVITQGERRLTTRDAVYDAQSQSFEVDNGVEYTDPDLTVRGSGAHLDPDGGATFEDTQFELPSRSARGSADRIRATSDGTLQLDKVRYTTCPIGNEDWLLRASDIDISQSAGIGVGRGVRLDFKGVPILYTPFISFPVGDERKSGFLFPTFGSSSHSGYSLSVPWYWNIAPNYDATFVPTWFSKRGGKLDTELRYLTGVGRGALQSELLPDDKEFGDQRSLLRFVDQSDFTRHLRLDIDAANASDSQWFQDFGLGPEGTSITYLNRSANLTYLNENWLAVLRAQNFQTIDDIGIAPADRPHTLLPQLAIRGLFPHQPFGLTLSADLEIARFEHNVRSLETGSRLDFAPEIRMPLRAAGIFLEPAASWRYTTYRLDGERDPFTGQRRDDSPHRAAPIFSVDGGMTFERNSGRRGQRLITLEPRFMYLHVPLREQSALPVFDTGAADLNLVQLFRTNRYVGADRLSDANQVAIGVTSRLLNAGTGEQFITGTIGQAYYFDPPRVALPGEVLEDPETSDIIAELDLTAYQNWNVSAGIQWDPGETRSEKGDIRLQYKPAADRVMNVGYRFRRDNIEQVDGSVAWPVARDWSLYAKMVYSLEDRSALDQFAGIEYRSCCWRMRLVARRYVTDRTGDLDTSILFQLELNGLSNVGVGADAFLERSIQGYSPGASRDPSERGPGR
jgi:LPS-assembly protein